MSFSSLEIPKEYGYVLFTCVIGPFISSFSMGVNVMKARKKYDVPLPNLYATPGFHKQADKFNRVQRGHQNFFETLMIFIPAALIGGIKHPIACAVHGILFSVGGYLYQLGYMDANTEVKTARHGKGGPVKYVGYFGAIGALASVGGTICGFW